MKVRLDGPDRATARRRYLGQREFPEEAKGNDLAVGFLEARDRCSKSVGALPAQDDLGRVVRPSRRLGSTELRGRRTERSGGGWLDPGQLTRPGSAAGVSQGNANGDPGEPCSERSVGSPCTKCAIGGHEGLLGSVLGIVQIAKDSVADPDDGTGLSLDQLPKRVAIAAQDGSHDTLGDLIRHSARLLKIPLQVDSPGSSCVSLGCDRATGHQSSGARP